jgi:hypothetical protein
MGGGGGSTSNCNGAMCQPWEECTPTVDGGICGDAQLTLAWTTPADMTRLRATQTVQATLSVTKRDGGTLPVKLMSVPVQGPGNPMPFQKAGGFMGTLGPLTGSDGPKQFLAGWDGGPTAPLTLVYDTTPPALDVELLNPPSYTSDGGFLTTDPDDGVAIPVIKKDDVVTVRVTSADPDIAGSTLAIAVTVGVDAGVELWDAGTSTTCGAATLCADFNLVVGPQQLRAFAADVQVSASAADKAGNVGSKTKNPLFHVTRWKWARSVVSASPSFTAAPAIAHGGDVYLPSSVGGAGQGVYHVTPTGAVMQDSSAGPVAAGITIGNDGTTQQIFFMTTNGGIQTVGDTMHSCGSAAAANVSSLAILNDGMASLYGIGVAGNGGSRQLVGLQAGFGCKPSTASSVDVAVPGNVVTDGQSVWYPGSDGTVQRFSFVGGASPSFTSLSSLPSVGAGTIFGLGLIPAATKLVGGGGGVGVGRLFVRGSDGTGTTTGYNQMAPVTGVAVGTGSALFAVTQAGGLGTLSKFDATGDIVVNSTALPAGFSFNFPAGVNPGATTPVLGNRGWVYATDNAGNVVATDQQSLEVKWLKPMSGALGSTAQVLASPSLDCNRTDASNNTGVYYFATTTGWLVAYIVDSPGLDSSAPWPKYQHDARNTGNTGVSIACP